MTTVKAVMDTGMLAEQRIRVFERRFGGEALQLACHAAFPMALTSELVYCLRENFVPDVPWYAAADVLLSGLCQPIGQDLYEMDSAVRMALLERLRLRFGEARVWALQDWMGDYILEQLDGEKLAAAEMGRSSRERSRILGDRPHWTALCCLRPGEVRQAIYEEVQRLGSDLTMRDRLHLSSMVEGYGALLPGEPILLEWAEQVDEGEPLRGIWDEWAADRGLTLVPQVVPVATIRFEDERSSLAQEEDPNRLREFEFQVVKLDDRGNISSRERQTASYFIEPLGDGVKPLELVAIPGGRFLMGSPKSEAQRESREGPQREVTVPPFFMSKYQVTQAQWKFVAETLPEVDRSIDSTPSRFEGADNPVEQVSWLDVQEFCARVTVLAGRTCRLPSEAEWEYACRAGTITPFHFGETISPEFANYDGNYTYEKGKKGVDRNKTIPVGSLNFPNSFGLYDMHGNVWEWCEDNFFHDNYEGAPIEGSAWKHASHDSGLKILRGGSWLHDPWDCRSACRDWNGSDRCHDGSGLRVVYSSARILDSPNPLGKAGWFHVSKRKTSST